MTDKNRYLIGHFLLFERSLGVPYGCLIKYFIFDIMIER